MAIAKNVIVANAMQATSPIGLVLRAGSILMPVAMIKPAETAPIPRNAPCIASESATPAIALAMMSTKIVGTNNKPAKAESAPRHPKCLPPIINARLITLGPGSICATDQSSTNSSSVSHFFFSTNSR